MVKKHSSQLYIFLLWVEWTAWVESIEWKPSEINRIPTSPEYLAQELMASYQQKAHDSELHKTEFYSKTNGTMKGLNFQQGKEINNI